MTIERYAACRKSLLTNLPPRERRQGGAELLKLRRNCYVRSREWAAMSTEQRHLLRVAAVSAARRQGDAVLSHSSAAVMYGLPTWGVDLQRVHVTRGQRSAGRVTGDMHVHSGSVSGSGLVAGLPVTTPARTVVDIARTVPFEQAVVIGDAALQRGLATRDQLSSELGAARHCTGIREAQKAIAFLDERSESPGESRSRVFMHRYGLQLPCLQASIRDKRGKVIARVDFLFPCGVVGEFDGRMKYGRGDDVFREKQREDALRRLGWLVVRWVWADLERPDELFHRISEALAEAKHRPAPVGEWSERPRC
ncbi:hypothetical protein [Hoyosella altamirensis]|uniref:DUF559 domain-containing protein n=1 Tax=Hoyosella altamirensis TaxID=616997 RepID=A0A839RHE9_9ACTN|nr:hypothetical protein [Hoyosella altamirensis]MBB3035709.1 hypothetical protein [Hoyosella altamirensis]